MTSRRLYIGFVVLLVLLGLGTLASVKVADSSLQTRSSKLANLKAQQEVANNQLAQLAQDKKDIAKFSELNKIAQSIVPQDKDQAEAVRQIANLAAQSGIPQLSSITFQNSTLGIKTTVKTSRGLTQVTPVKGISGVYDLQITVQQTNQNEVPYSRFISFLEKLEQNRRTAQVSGISIQPDIKDPSQVAFTLIIDEFIKP